jgi:hypothetical protein
MDIEDLLKQQINEMAQIGLTIGNKFGRVLKTKVAWNFERDWRFEKSVFYGAQIECSVSEVNPESRIAIIKYPALSKLDENDVETAFFAQSAIVINYSDLDNLEEILAPHL